MTTQTKHRFYSERRRFIKSKVGQWHPGSGVSLRGHDLFEDLYVNISEAQLVVFAATGKWVSGAVETWLDKARFLLAYPDARIWCNQIASLSAAQQASPVAAIVNGFLASDSRAYGCYSQTRVCELIPAIYEYYKNGKDFDELLGLFQKGEFGYSIPGFLRPVNVVDERIEPMRKLTARLGLKPGPFLSFAESFSEYLETKMHLGINAAGYCGAFMLDQGFTAEEVYLISATNIEIGALACISEYRSEPENSLLPLHCADIEYQGPQPRKLPETNEQCAEVV